ncbi:Vitamin B12 transporter BtuB [Porphyromonas levii]|uniref:TonB-dependent receptor n=2 Tax=Porphyromonas levii TaxID=28114 RepID=A0A4Y8WS51_9PORP|nr:Vitamin B12 transporter BtuB [Porphyromonas levii]TFH97361.1 TonB-dependent receptor [Porphyromonas levii]TFH97473.1 TonB-dependent receptor [Porphyromonas levii]
MVGEVNSLYLCYRNQVTNYNIFKTFMKLSQRAIAMVMLFTIGGGVMVPSFAATLPSQRVEAQVTDANIVGHVIDKATGEHLIGVVVRIKGSAYGTTTDTSGHFYLRNLKPGSYTIEVSGVGYQKTTQTITVVEHKTIEINIALEEDVFNLHEVVISANRQQTLRKYAPTLVSVIDNKAFETNNATNLAQGLSFQPGIRVENNCQNCGFNQVRINGLDGRFSQILIDSRPIFSALAGVYGLEQIPANMIERVEIVRGGGSALYGSSAIAGVINIITQEPVSNRFEAYENLTMTGMTTPDNTVGFNASIVGSDGRIGGTVFGQARDRGAWDANGDGFSEVGMIRGRSVGAHGFIRLSEFDRITSELHTLQEYRRGGDRLDLPVHVAAVAEQTDHTIYSGNLKYDHNSLNLLHRLQVFASGQVVKRTSYYGGIGDANVGKLGFIPKKEFGTNFGNTTGKTFQGGLQYSYEWDTAPIAPIKFLAGVEYVYDSLYDIMPIRAWEKDTKGNSLNPPIDQRIHNASQIAQAEWGNDYWTILLGMRMDEHSAIKSSKGGIRPIISPRATVRYNPSEYFNIRASYAKGFRAPQVFDEDLHVGVVGGEAQRVYNSPNLKPEESHSFSLSTDMYFTIGAVQTNFLIEGFYTKLVGAFTNRERTDAPKLGFQVFDRVNGSGAQVYGINLEAKAHWNKLNVQGGLTLARSLWDAPQEWGNRSLLAKEDANEPKEVNTLVDHGPSTLAGFNMEEGEVAMTSKQMLKTPNIYGYLTARYNPVTPLTLSLSLNYTGKMYVPHVVTVGQMAEVNDIHMVKNGLRPNTTELKKAPRWDRLEVSPNYFDLGAKVSYDIKVFNTSIIQLYLGMHNMLNSFQKDYDVTGNRDSGYIHGPTTPRSFYSGLKIIL